MKANFLTWLIPFLLGIFLTVLVFDLQPQPNLPDPSTDVSSTPVADKLNAYSCRVAETKEIILGGEEDGFSLTGEEVNRPGSFAEYRKNRTGSKDSVDIKRGYDEGGQDSTFLETLELPSNIAHGIIVMRIRLLSSLRNDVVVIGGLNQGHKFSEMNRFTFSHSNNNSGWTLDGEVLSAQLNELTFPQRFGPDRKPLVRNYKTALEFVQRSGKPLNIAIQDDTMVDVVGLALCIEPERGRGVSFLVNDFDHELVSLRCDTPQKEDHCSVYKGDTSCETELPVACFSDEGETLPEQFKDVMAGNLAEWSGGVIKFSKPIQASTFKTQSQVNHYCKTKFGSSFRVANIHDGIPSQALTARGQANETKQAWIDSNLEPYANCWAIKTDYPEELEDE